MARKFFFKRSQHLLRAFFLGVASFLGVVAVCGAILAFSLSAGPLPLDFAIPYLDNLLSSSETAYRVNVDKAHLIWDKDEHCLAIQAEGVHLQHEAIDHNAVSLPSFELKYKITSLLKFKFIPFEVEIIEPYLHLYQGPDGSYSITKQQDPKQPPGDMNRLLEDFILSGLKTIRNVRISNLHLDVLDLNTSEKWGVPRLDLHFQREGRIINCELSADTRGAQAGGKAKLILNKVDGKLNTVDIDVNGYLADFNFDDLDKFWHSLLAPTPRGWIMENLSGATVHKADLNAKWKLDFAQSSPSLTLLDMGGEIHFTGMKVFYFGDLPPVTDVDGFAKYSHKAFDITVLKGQLQDMKVTGGRVFIQNLDKPDQFIDIDVDIHGPLQTALAILDKKPIHLSQKIDLKPDKIKGPATGKIHFNFPLETSITINDVNFKAEASLKNITMAKPLGAKTTRDLKDGSFNLSVNRDRLTVKGTGQYGPLRVAILWQQKFDDNPQDWQVRYDVETTLQPEHLKQLGYEGYTEGPILVKADLTENKDKSQTLHSNLDFTQAKILLPLIDQVHIPGNKAHVQLEAKLHDGELQKITQIHILGKDIDISPAITLDPKSGSLNTLNCTNAKLGQNNLSVKLRRDEKDQYRIDLKGKSLDLDAIVKYIKSIESKSDPITPFHFNCAVEYAWFHEGKKSLRELKANGFHDRNVLQTCAISGQLFDEKQNQVGDIRVDQTLSDQKEKLLLITSSNAGETLDLLGLTTAVSGGDLKLEMAKQVNRNWSGKLKLSGFHLKEAPTVTRILSVISPFGIIEAVAGKPLAFSKFSAKLIYEEDRLLIKQGRGIGASLGLNVNGIIDRKNDSLDLHGTILPYNAINVFLAKVPIVSQLLGGKGGGIFGFQYAITGSMEDPTTFVNPLSVLTPGILRNVFAHPDPEESDQEKSDE